MKFFVNNWSKNYKEIHNNFILDKYKKMNLLKIKKIYIVFLKKFCKNMIKYSFNKIFQLFILMILMIIYKKI